MARLQVLRAKKVKKKKYIHTLKIFFKVGTKITKKMKQNFFFRPTEKQKKPSVQKVSLYRIYGELLHLKLICTPKNAFLLRQGWFLEGVGVPGGCKSILNVKILHNSHIAKIFGPRGFCFSVDQKKVLFHNFGDFCSDLKIFLIYEDF